MTEQPPAGFDPAIVTYYDQAPEESRLEQGAFRLEAVRTRELIERHAAPPPATVLDVGGAAGAYAFWLAERGYTVHLVDAVPRLVEEAGRRNASAPHAIASCRVGDARSLPFEDGSAELVLMLGPLYHLVEATDRNAALREAARVLQPGGVLIAAGISRCASALDGLARDLLGDASFASIVEQDLRDGQHRNPTANLEYFTTAYFHRPEDLGAEVERAGLTVEGLYGIEGPGWMLSDLDDRWADPGRREVILHVARLLEAEPSVRGCSAHLLVVGRKDSPRAGNVAKVRRSRDHVTGTKNGSTPRLADPVCDRSSSRLVSPRGPRERTPGNWTIQGFGISSSVLSRKNESTPKGSAMPKTGPALKRISGGQLSPDVEKIGKRFSTLPWLERGNSSVLLPKLSIVKT